MIALALAAPSVAFAQRNRDRTRENRDDGPQATERIDRTASIRAGGKLRLNNFSGHVTITGSNRADISIHAIRTATQDRLDHIKLDITETGSGVTIEANRRDGSSENENNNVVNTEFDIQVPADISLDIDVFSSSVVVSNVRGDQRVHTFSGAIDLSGAESAIDAETFSGDINVKLVNGASAALDFDSFSGSVRTDVPINYTGADGHHVRGSIGAGGTDYHFKTFSGSLRIR